MTANTEDYLVLYNTNLLKYSTVKNAVSNNTTKNLTFLILQQSNRIGSDETILQTVFDLHLITLHISILPKIILFHIPPAPAQTLHTGTLQQTIHNKERTYAITHCIF